MERNRVAGLLAFLLFCAVTGCALNQTGPADDGDNDEDDIPSASIGIHFTSQNSARVDFSLPQEPPSWPLMRIALARALHCSPERFTTPLVYRPQPGELSYLTQEQRDQYEKFLVDYSQRSLVADCPGILTERSLVRERTFDFRSIAEELKRAGAQELSVSISLPEARYVDCSRQYLLGSPANTRNPSSRTRSPIFLEYRIPLADVSNLAPVHFAYGFRASDLLRSGLIVAGFILLPLVICVWMRSAVLKSGRDDPTAAWFSFFRTLNWCINGGTLVWIMSGLDARQILQDWIRFRDFPGVEGIFLDVLVVIGPAFLMYFLCIAVSYPVHVQLRASKRSRREYLLQSSVNLGAQAFPLMFFLAGMASIGTSSRAVAVLFLLAYVSWVICQNLRLKLNKSYPHALTTGELRDRIFDLAKLAGVKLGQIFVVPAGKDQIANAYAMKARTVMFTDYLLQHLTKREVDGVAAHELAHLQHRHVGKRMAALYFAILLPAILNGFLRGLFETSLRRVSLHNPTMAHLSFSLNWFWQWSQRDFVTLVVGLSGFYILSRHFEHAADEGAVLLTGDAEAQITGLLKLSRLNLMPIQWGKGTGAWITHPTTLKRAERIAASSGMSAEQLQLILQRYQAGRNAPADSATPADTMDHYVIPLGTHEESVREAARKWHAQQSRFWLALLAHVVPPAIIVLLVRGLHPQDTPALSLYVLGALLTPWFGTILDAWLQVHRRRTQRAHLAQLLHLEERAGDPSNWILVGFSPGAAPRFYGANSYNWDVGFLRISEKFIEFIGEQTKFSLQRDRVDGMCLGPGGPSWWRSPRLYVRWRDGETLSVFSVVDLEPCTLGQVSPRSRALYDRLRTWKDEGMSWSDVTANSDLPPLALGKVTGISPGLLGSLRTNLRVLVYLIPLALIVNAGLRLDAIAYMLSVVLWTRIFESIPYRRYHDPLLSFAPQGSKTRAAKANE